MNIPFYLSDDLERACLDNDLDTVKRLMTKVFSEIEGEGIYKSYNYYNCTYSPFDYACRCGHLAIVKYLVEIGWNFRFDNDCALYCAISEGHLKVVKYLVEQGADVRVIEGRYCSDLLTVKYLVSHGVDSNLIFIGSSPYDVETFFERERLVNHEGKEHSSISCLRSCS